MTDTEQTIIDTVPASGAVALELRSTNRKAWTVKQVGIRAPNVGGGAIGNITKNGLIITPFVPYGDAPAGEPFITLRPGDVMATEWTSAAVGATVEATYFYDDGT